jgi:hypothetical protein
MVMILTDEQANYGAEIALLPDLLRRQAAMTWGFSYPHSPRGCSPVPQSVAGATGAEAVCWPFGGGVREATSMMTTPGGGSATRLRSALLVDAENMSAGLGAVEGAAADEFIANPDRWLTWLSTLDYPQVAGNVQREFLVRICYLNPGWRGGVARQSFVQAGFQVVDCPTLTSAGKNSADIHMVIAMLDLLAHPTHFDEIMVMSSDADFTPALARIRAHDRRTVVVASGPYASVLKASCDHLVPVERFVNEALKGSTGYTRAQAVPPPPTTAAAKKASAKKAATAKQAAAKKAAAQQTADKQTAVKQPTVKQPAVNQTAVKQPAAKQPAVNQTAVNQTAVKQPAVNQTAVNQTAVKQPAAKQPAVNQTAVNQTADKQPAVREPAVKLTAAEKRAAKKKTAATAAKPAGIEEMLSGAAATKKAPVKAIKKAPAKKVAAKKTAAKATAAKPASKTATAQESLTLPGFETGSLSDTAHQRAGDAVRGLVAGSSGPVMLSNVAEPVRIALGDQAERWAGAFRLKKLLHRLDLNGLVVADVSPGYVYDPDRHQQPGLPPF